MFSVPVQRATFLEKDSKLGHHHVWHEICMLVMSRPSVVWHLNNLSQLALNGCIVPGQCDQACELHSCVSSMLMSLCDPAALWMYHDDVIKWKHFLCYWPFVWGIHWSLMNSPHKGQWCRALMFSLICAWINSWVNNLEAGDLRCHHAHYDVTVMYKYALYHNVWDKNR